MSFVEKFLAKQKELDEKTIEDQGDPVTPTEEVTEKVEETPPVDPPVTEEIVEKEEIKEDPDVKVEDKKEETPAPTFDRGAWITEHKDDLYNYLSEVNRDYDTMNPEQLVKLKLKKDNPAWTDQEVEQELSELYHVGSDLITIDKMEMLDEEIKEAERHNKEVLRAHRLLKTDAKVAQDHFNEYKSKLEIPEFNLPTGETDIDSILAQEEAQYAKQVEEAQNTWRGLIDKGVGAVASVTKKITFEDNKSPVEISVDYKLSDKQKADLQANLYDYVAQPGDDKRYVQEDGSIDIEGFVRSQAEKEFFDNILKTALVEYGAMVRKSILKDRVNYTDEIPTQPSGGGGDDSIDNVAKSVWASRKRQF